MCLRCVLCVRGEELRLCGCACCCWWWSVPSATAEWYCCKASHLHGHGCQNQGRLWNNCPICMDDARSVCFVTDTCRKCLSTQELGYPGDCGYNQLLYPTEDSMRDILNWLMNKLPRAEEDRTEEVLGPNALLNRRIMGALEVRLMLKARHSASTGLTSGAHANTQDWRHTAWEKPFSYEGKKKMYKPLHRTYALQTFPMRQRSGARFVVDMVGACTMHPRVSDAQTLTQLKRSCRSQQEYVQSRQCSSSMLHS